MKNSIQSFLTCLIVPLLIVSPQQQAAAEGQQTHQRQSEKKWRTVVRDIQNLPNAQQPNALLAALRANIEMHRSKATPGNHIAIPASQLDELNALPFTQKQAAIAELLAARKSQADRVLQDASIRKSSTAGIVSESEPNENAATADVITPGEMIAGNTSSGTDQDWFRFTANAGDIIDAFVFAEEFYSSLDGYLVLYAGDGSTILAVSDDYEQRDPRILYQLPAAGTYYLQLTAFDEEALGDYELSFTVMGNSNENEPNNGISSAGVLSTLPYAAFGEIGQKDDSDFYTITLGAGQSVGVRLEAATEDALPDLVLAVYDATGFLLAVNDDHLGGRYFNAELALKNNSAQPAIFYLQAATFQNQETGNYVISVREIGAAAPSTFYAALGDSGGGRFLSLDMASGQASVVGYSRFHGASAMAINNFGEIFAARGGQEDTPIFRIDPESGNGYGVAAIFDLADVHAIAFDSQDRLYAMNSLNELHLIHFSARSSTKILGLPPAGGLVQGMAFEPETGRLFFAQNGAIWRIELSIGVPALVGNTGLAKPITELYFDRAGQLFGVSGDDLQASTIVAINKSNGSTATIGTTGFIGVAGAAAAVEHQLDVQLDAILAPKSAPPFGATEPVTVSLKNNGSLYRTALPVSYRLTGPASTTATENTGSLIILPGQSSQFTFQKSIDLRTIGTYTLEVFVSASGDANSANDTLSITIQNGTTSVADERFAPSDFALRQNYPNPFNPETAIAFELPGAEQVRLLIYNAIGQKVRTLLAKPFVAGRHSVVWDGKNDSGKVVPSGLYFYEMTAGDYTALKKMILMR